MDSDLKGFNAVSPGIRYVIHREVAIAVLIGVLPNLRLYDEAQASLLQHPKARGKKELIQVL